MLGATFAVGRINFMPVTGAPVADAKSTILPASAGLVDEGAQEPPRVSRTTYSLRPHLHVSELQHCPCSTPIQLAFLCFGPQLPSKALSGSMTVLGQHQHPKSPLLGTDNMHLHPTTHYFVQGLMFSQSFPTSGLNEMNCSTPRILYYLAKSAQVSRPGFSSVLPCIR